MGELTDLLKAQSSSPQENYFFPESGNPALVGLGLLDLVLGAPARTVQGGLINLLRGENVLTGMGRGFAGLGLDTGEFGEGDVASGFQLLSEIGLVEDRSLGNVLLGAGVDVATDLAMFNLAGAARKAVGLGGRGARLTGGHPGLRSLGGKKPHLLTTYRETSLYKQDILKALKVDQFQKVMDDLSDLGVRFWNKESSPGLFEASDAVPALREAQNYDEAVSAGSALYHLKAGNINFSREAEKLFDLTNVKAVYTGDKEALQKAIFSPALAKLGAGAGRGVLAEMTPLRSAFTDLKNFEVVSADVVKGFSKGEQFRGMQRPIALFDVSFDNPYFLKGYKNSIPANRPLKISLEAKEFSTSIADALPPWADFRDYIDVVKKLGFDDLIVASNQYVDNHNRLTRRLTDAFSKAGILPGQEITKEFYRVFQGLRWGLPGSVRIGKKFFEKYPHLVDTYKELRSVLDEIADMPLRYADGAPVLDRAGSPVLNLPKSNRVRGIYLPTARTDFPGRIEQDVIQLGGAKIKMAGDLPDRIFVASFQRAEGWSDVLEEDLFKVMQGYITAGLRRAHFQPVLDQIRPIMERLNQKVTVSGGRVRTYANLKHKAENMIHHFVGGHYHRIDQWTDDMLNKIPGFNARFGDASRSATKFVNWNIALNFLGRIGFSLRTASLQALQLTMNNVMEFGFGESLRGFFRYVKDGKRLKSVMQKNHVFDTMLNEEFRVTREGVDALRRPAQFAGKARARTVKAWDLLQKAAFAPLQAMDNLNRGITFHTAYGMAKRMGYADEFAIAKGVEASNAAHFIYGKVGSSPVKFHPISRALFQFWSFGGKQLSFLADKARRDPLTSVLRYMAVTGMITRSVGKVVDIDRDLVPFSPGDVANLMSFKSVPAYEPIRALITFGWAMAGDPSVDVNFAKEWFLRSALKAWVPGGTQAERFMRYGPTATGGAIPAETPIGGIHTGGEGQELDKYGRTVRALPEGEAWAGMFGFRSRRSSEDFDLYRDIAFQTDWVNHRKGYMMTQAIRAYRSGRDFTPWLISAYKIGGGTWAALMQGFRQRIMNSRMSRIERAKKRAPKSVQALY